MRGRPKPPETTLILRFLHEHSGKVLCARCISASLFNGRDLDVAMRRVEALGIKRNYGRCSECGKSRLVAGVTAN